MENLNDLDVCWHCIGPSIAVDGWPYYNKIWDAQWYNAMLLRQMRSMHDIQ